MIGLLLILLQTHSFAAVNAPGCQELSSIVSSMEKNLQTKSAKSCQELDIAQLFPKAISSELTAVFDENKCQPLYQIETKIAELENQEALLLGFEKLKNHMQETQEILSTERKAELVQASAKSFTQALNTAQTIELMLNTKMPGEEASFIQMLAVEEDDQWSNVSKLKSLASRFCEKMGQKKQNYPVCSEAFMPNEQTHKELKELLSSRRLTHDQAREWRESLMIQTQDGKAYSFTTMAASLEDDYAKMISGEKLNNEQFARLRALERFRSNPKFSFLNKLPEARKDQNIITDRMKYHAINLSKRQETEVNAKMSLVASLNKNLMGPDEQNACANTKILSDLDQLCLSALRSAHNRLKQTQTNDQVSQLGEAIASFEKSDSYSKKLKDLASVCESNPSTCAEGLPLNLANVSDELSALRIIKESISKEQMQNMDFRNFAISRWTHNCSEQIDAQKSIIEECNDTLSQIAPEMFKLTNSILDISVTIDPKKAPAADKIKTLCEDESVKKLQDQKRLCAFFEDSVSDELPPPDKSTNEAKKKAESYMAPVEAPDGGNSSTRDAWLRGLATIANTAVGAYLNNPNQGYFNMNTNPYMYNYAPYSLTAGMGTADAILFNARYYGAYGLYMPTQGLQPYTAFGAGSISSYHALPKSSGSYSYFSK